MNTRDLFTEATYLSTSMLDMKPRCERCHGHLPEEQVAYICAYECTFCANCSTWFQYQCPNCATELVRRPRRNLDDAERRERAAPPA